MIITVTLTPALDKTITLPDFAVNKVNRVQTMRLDAGGKGINVSKVLKMLGTDSLATGIVGGSTGKFITDSMTEMGIQCDFITVENDTRTNLKVIDPINHTNTDINEAGAPVSGETMQNVLDKILSYSRENDIVVFAGKAPAGTPDTIFAEWTAKLKQKGVKVYLDADAGLLIEGVKALPSLIKPNDEELSRLSGRRLENFDDIVNAAKHLVSEGIETVVVSLGGDGALFVKNDCVLRAEGLRVKVQSTVGAGDSMMATMCYGAVSGLSFEETCRLAVAVSAAAVTMPGTQAPELNYVHTLLGQVKLTKLL